MRKKLTTIKVKSRQIMYNTIINLSINSSSFVAISSTLDIIRFKFNDLTHSEYGNIIKLLYIFLINVILTSKV